MEGASEKVLKLNTDLFVTLTSSCLHGLPFYNNQMLPQFYNWIMLDSFLQFFNSKFYVVHLFRAAHCGPSLELSIGTACSIRGVAIGGYIGALTGVALFRCSPLGNS
jgi:hypothetical protein